MPKKRFKRLRWCWANIVNNCIDPFTAETKRAQRVCRNCNTRLKELGLTIWRYKQMVEKKHEESVEWHNRNECTIIIKEYMPLKSGEEVIGHSEHMTKAKTKYEDLKANYDNRKQTLENLQKQVTLSKAKLEKIGKKPAKTSEMVRLERSLETMGKLKNYEEIENQLKLQEKQLADEKAAVAQREKIFATRPKK